MDEPRWLCEGTRWHAYCPGHPRSLCNQALLPVDFGQGRDEYHPRCGNCQRIVVQRLSSAQQAAAPPAARWRDIATQAVMGDGWAYTDLENMPSWCEPVDRVAVALAEAYGEGTRQ